MDISSDAAAARDGGLTYRGFTIDVYEASHIGWVADSWAPARGGTVYAATSRDAVEKAKRAIDAMLAEREAAE